ncbi:MAG: diphosphomevalonate decarboxylase [Alphaproteobacteria bacterium]|nr:diphosphomevalonate decarboxylase [Alphaproteobacteria bacterium]
MKNSIWTASAPSNIALIKYMGKLDGNIPCNASLSYTLDKYRTVVTLKISDNDNFVNSENLSDESVQKFMKHLDYIRQVFGCKEKFYVISENNFQHSAGIASSASSFAALTLCACKAISDLLHIDTPSLKEMSEISRVGSGSSCRSFFSPWSLWQAESAEAIELPILKHELVLIDTKVKPVSSSRAHELVRTSYLFEGRIARAEKRLASLIFALQKKDWQRCYQICWEEFWDMHALFETSNPHFGYFSSQTLQKLRDIEHLWKRYNDGPIVTIDAGANIHLLWHQ